MMCRFHVQTAGSSLTAQSVDNNVVRTTIQALAAVLGGAQSLHTNARDEALALPTEAAARLALRTQQIIAYESGVTETPDPLAGSYYVETLTDQLEEAAQDYLARSTRWAARSRPSRRASSSARSRRRRTGSSVRSRRRARRGRRQPVRDDDEGHRADCSASIPGGARPGRADRRVRAERDAPLGGGDGRLGEAAAAGENLMPAIIDAVKAQATLGEISDRLRSAWGEHRELLTI